MRDIRQVSRRGWGLYSPLHIGFSDFGCVFNRDSIGRLCPLSSIILNLWATRLLSDFCYNTAEREVPPAENTLSLVIDWDALVVRHT